MKSIAGKVCVVTGSTSGIGLGIVKVLAEHGCALTINGFNDSKDAVDKTIQELKSMGAVDVIYSPADLSQESGVKELVDQTVAHFGRIDVLINNAGIQHVAPVAEFPVEKWNAILALNLSACFHGIRYALPHMRQHQFGRIINIASAHGLVASTGKAAYVAAKHGVLGLTKVVGLETAKEPITCNAICPGWVKTPLVEKQIESRVEAEHISLEQATLELLGEKQPSHQFVTPEQIGNLCAFLISDAAEQMTGSSYSIDGGWVAQ